MKNIYRNIVFAGVILTFLCAFIILWTKNNNKHNSIIAQNNKAIARMEDYSALIEKNLFFNISNSNVQLNNIDLISDNGENIKLYDLFHERGEKIVLYSGLEYCNSCIEYQIQNVIWLSKILGKDNVIMIIYKLTTREIILLKIKYNIEFVLIGSHEPIGLPIEKEYLPVYFITNNLFISKDIFIPFKDKNEYNKKYFDIIINKYHLNQ